jgi:DNA-binding MarR family transcriptional regulator
VAGAAEAAASASAGRSGVNVMSSSVSFDVKSLDGDYSWSMSADRRPADDVDEIVAAWRRERPDLDVSPLEVLSRVSRLARRLDLARGSAFSEHLLDGWAFDVLSALRRAGEPYELSPGQLVQQTLVTSGTMTNRVDRLERSGFVERRPDPGDRRGVLVRLTPAGRDVVDSAMADLIEQEKSLLSQLSAADRTQLAGLLRRMLAPLEMRETRETRESRRGDAHG